MNKNWKTTVSSVVSAAAGFVLFAQNAHYVTFPPLVVGISGFLSVGGLAALGVSAKDSNVTGGTVASTPEAQARIEPK